MSLLAYMSFVFGWSWLFAQGAPPVVTPAPDAATLAARVQRFYDGAKDFTATFEQTYTYKAFGSQQVSRGTVKVKKPGLMRWDYREPTEKHFILDGKAMWMHVPQDNQVTVNRTFAADQLSAAVTFLWGKGKLSDEFEIKSAARRDLEGPVLELLPKKGQTQFQRLYFSVDPATGRVRASIVVDPQGNENRMVFTEARTNAGLKDGEFEFKPPKGAAVQEL